MPAFLPLRGCGPPRSYHHLGIQSEIENPPADSGFAENSLKLNSAAQAGRLRIEISGTAVDAARTFLRERVLVDLLIASSLGCFSAFLLAKEFYHSLTFARWTAYPSTFVGIVAPATTTEQVP